MLRRRQQCGAITAYTVEVHLIPIALRRCTTNARHLLGSPLAVHMYKHKGCSHFVWMVCVEARSVLQKFDMGIAASCCARGYISVQ